MDAQRNGRKKHARKQPREANAKHRGAEAKRIARGEADSEKPPKPPMRAQGGKKLELGGQTDAKNY